MDREELKRVIEMVLYDDIFEVSWQGLVNAGYMDQDVIEHDGQLDDEQYARISIAAHLLEQLEVV